MNGDDVVILLRSTPRHFTRASMRRMLKEKLGCASAIRCEVNAQNTLPTLGRVEPVLLPAKMVLGATSHCNC